LLEHDCPPEFLIECEELRRAGNAGSRGHADFAIHAELRGRGLASHVAVTLPWSHCEEAHQHALDAAALFQDEGGLISDADRLAGLVDHPDCPRRRVREASGCNRTVVSRPMSVLACRRNEEIYATADRLGRRVTQQRLCRPVPEDDLPASIGEECGPM